jgi:hypothetical protein
MNPIANLEDLPQSDAFGRLMLMTALLPGTIFLGLFTALSVGILAAGDWSL